MGKNWTCPRCGRQFANTNQWHSCIELELDEHLATKSPEAVALYQAVYNALTASGDFRIHPQKTRIAFISAMTFAGVHLATRWADLNFITARAIDDERINKLELYGPTSFGHTVRLAGTDDVDVALRGWLAESLRRGNQESLDPTARVEPLIGRPLALVTVPLRSRIVEDSGRLAFQVPRYATDALEAAPRVVARINGEHHLGSIGREESGAGLLHTEDDPAVSGLGAGETADVFLRADV